MWIVLLDEITVRSSHIMQLIQFLFERNDPTIVFWNEFFFSWSILEYNETAAK